MSMVCWTTKVQFHTQGSASLPQKTTLPETACLQAAFTLTWWCRQVTKAQKSCLVDSLACHSTKLIRAVAAGIPLWCRHVEKMQVWSVRRQISFSFGLLKVDKVKWSGINFDCHFTEDCFLIWAQLDGSKQPVDSGYQPVSMLYKLWIGSV